MESNGKVSQKEKKKGALMRILGYAGAYRYLTYLSFILSGASAVTGLMPFVYLWRIIREALRAYPDFGKAVGIVSNGWMAVWFSLITMLLYFAALMCSHIAAFRTAAGMKKALLSHIAMLPPGFADEMGSGKLRRVVLETTASTETMLAHNLPDMVQAMATPLCIVVMLFLFDWRFGLVCLVPVVIAFACMMKMTGPAMAEDMKRYQDSLEKMSNEAVEYVRGIPVVKTFGQTVFSFHRFKKSIDDYSKFCIRYTKRMRPPMLQFTVFLNSAFAFLICLALFLAGNSQAPQDILASFLFYVIFTPAIVTTMNRVMFLSENTMLLQDAMDRVDEVLDMKPLPEAETQAQHLQGASVELSHVTYRYRGDADAAVKDLSLKAEENGIIALVGPSGSGKTTAAGLISRFFDPEEGNVRIGGADVRDIPKAELMDTVSYVFQNSKLLKRSIADNLKIAKPDASEDEIKEALTLARCGDIIDRLPQGIHTVLGSEGTYLSGGEEQRIAIARAILKRAPVVILDEATAFADPENEALVQKAFGELMKRSTVIMIAHRLSTIRNADRIYVLDKGSVKEEGTHDELLERNGLYAEMWGEYLKAASWKVSALREGKEV
ncbi:MAG: ABC transporter ATP-binding protein [Lachnospiraceae bacterium]|nr:ABC transporter ATP-binding protein [Lachnospiraceae bacterium]